MSYTKDFWSNSPIATAALKLPIKTENQQQIYLTALQRALKSKDFTTLPPRLGFKLAQIQKLKRRHADLTLFASPAAMETIFGNITLADFEEVRQLYCTPLARSIDTIWLILSRKAAFLGQVALEYEAVWAICLYLDEARKQQADASYRHQELTRWYLLYQPLENITLLTPPGKNPGPGDRACFTLLYILEKGVEATRPIALRICPGEIIPASPDQEKAGLSPVQESEINILLFEAIAARRTPDIKGTAGLVWWLPTHLFVEATLQLNNLCRATLSELGVEVRGVQVEKQSLETLAAPLTPDWTRDINGRSFRYRELLEVVDNYFYRTFDYSPLHQKKLNQKQYQHRQGWNQPPDTLFATLRRLLPPLETVIDEKGQIEWEGLHYTHEILTCFKGYRVNLRVAPPIVATGWIYLQDKDAILVEAKAVELKRANSDTYLPTHYDQLVQAL